MYAHGREAVISHLVAGRGVTAGAPRRHARGTHGGRFARPDRQTDRQTLSVCLICLILILSYLMCRAASAEVPPAHSLPRAQMAGTSSGARLTLAAGLQPRPDRPATIPLPPGVTVRIGRVDGQAPADSAAVHTVGLNSREHSAMWKSRPMWPASMNAAQAADRPRLAEARGSLGHDRALTEA